MSTEEPQELPARPPIGPRHGPPAVAPTPTRGGWRGWFWISLFLCLLLMGSLGLNFVLGAVAAGKSGGKYGGRVSLKGFTSTLVDGEESADEFIAVVPVQGVIMESPSNDSDGKGSLSRLKKLLRELKKQKKLKGILLLVDSPGGGVTCSDVMYHELCEFKKETKIPIVALFQDVAASGGYYVAMSADHIIAHQTSITGSIGVISHFYNLTGLMDKVGVKVNTIKSLNSEGQESFKDIGSPYRPMRPDEKALMQGLITEMWDRFTQVVAEGRKGKLTLDEIKKLADGRVFTGPQALKAKLVDSIGYPDAAYAKARELAKSPDAKILRFSKEKDWEEIFGGQTHVPGLEMAQKVMGTLDEPRFLYLWDGR